MIPSVRKSATLQQDDTWRKDRRLRLHHACIVFMCILRFHARAGYLQHYEALLKEFKEHVPEDVVPQAVPDDQYAVECVALADRNHNLPSETGLQYPSLLVMNNTCTYLDIMYVAQAGTIQSAGCVRLNINLL